MKPQLIAVIACSLASSAAAGPIGAPRDGRLDAARPLNPALQADVPGSMPPAADDGPATRQQVMQGDVHAGLDRDGHEDEVVIAVPHRAGHRTVLDVLLLPLQKVTRNGKELLRGIFAAGNDDSELNAKVVWQREIRQLGRGTLFSKLPDDIETEKHHHKHKHDKDKHKHKHDHEEPGRPDKPHEPKKPGKPEEPHKPDHPKEPGKPHQPGRPEEPGKPSKPSKPGKPDKDQPGKPPVKPTNTVTTVPSGIPGTPGPTAAEVDESARYSAHIMNTYTDLPNPEPLERLMPFVGSDEFYPYPSSQHDQQNFNPASPAADGSPAAASAESQDGCQIQTYIYASPLEPLARNPLLGVGLAAIIFLCAYCTVKLLAFRSRSRSIMLTGVEKPIIINPVARTVLDDDLPYVDSPYQVIRGGDGVEYILDADCDQFDSLRAVEQAERYTSEKSHEWL
ncbi:hypothetical protein KEM52_000004 [Ascosphaera acerosa]|nr:hypothetical protein KEM52_000004 [Ascosphaera acerosa]